VRLLVTVPLWLAVANVAFAAIGALTVAWIAWHLPDWWRDLDAEDRAVDLTRRTADHEAATEYPPESPDLTLFASSRVP
jgi:hypothetical protein